MAIADRIVELRRLKASELAPDPRNWRRHPEAQRQALRAVLDQVGFADAVLARETPEGLVLVDGHLRADLDPEGLLPVLVLDVTEQEAAALLATLDPLAAMALPDAEALGRLMAAAVIPDELLSARLFSMAADGLLMGKTDPDAIPDKRKVPRVRPGEVWALGDHRLACGDARDSGAWDRLMGGEQGQVLWTDPPYGVDYVGKTPRALRLAGDVRPGLDDLLGEAFARVGERLVPGARLYVCHPTGPGAQSFHAAFTGAGWRHHQSLVWVKDRMVLGHADYHHRHEGILYGYVPAPGRWGRGARGWYGGNAQDSVLQVDRPAASREHPTAKPVELITKCLANSSKQGDVILDPFSGSGSTIIAAHMLGRRAFCMELDSTYVGVALDRWEAFTGERATRVDA